MWFAGPFGMLVPFAADDEVIEGRGEATISVDQVAVQAQLDECVPGD
jgi:hypothetical protein